MAEESIIELQNLTRRYEMGEVIVCALDHLNLAVRKGEFVVLLGPSGSGKTTTLNLIGGLDRPSEGRVLVQGEDISAYGEKQLTRYRRSSVGFVFQFFNLIPTLNAEENVEFALALTGRDGQQALELLELVGLKARASHFPSQLSGGEQQRVAIARALANQPPLLLCDEPTGNLDVDTGRQVLQVLRDLNRKEGATVILVTHNTAIAPMADRVVRLRDGAVDHVETQREAVPVSELSW